MDTYPQSFDVSTKKHCPRLPSHLLDAVGFASSLFLLVSSGSQARMVLAPKGSDDYFIAPPETRTAKHFEIRQKENALITPNLFRFGRRVDTNNREAYDSARV